MNKKESGIPLHLPPPKYPISCTYPIALLTNLSVPKGDRSSTHLPFLCPEPLAAVIVTQKHILTHVFPFPLIPSEVLTRVEGIESATYVATVSNTCYNQWVYPCNLITSSCIHKCGCEQLFKSPPCCNPDSDSHQSHTPSILPHRILPRHTLDLFPTRTPRRDSSLYPRSLHGARR